MPLIRKAQAGSDSHGHTWPEDGAVVEVTDPEQIAALIAIPDGGFSEVTPQGRTTRADDEALPVGAELSEIDPRAEDAEAPRRRGRRPASRE
ncbi:hypothetical protein [Streptomyces abikoensis]|uniref:Uncharacterized protein n=1 Tax=Streptomyces abikoensis TaxID=97398 RepID=A0ABW7T9P0_9ACTN